MLRSTCAGVRIAQRPDNITIRGVVMPSLGVLAYMPKPLVGLIDVNGIEGDFKVISSWHGTGDVPWVVSTWDENGIDAECRLATLVPEPELNQVRVDLILAGDEEWDRVSAGYLSREDAAKVTPRITDALDGGLLPVMYAKIAGSQPYYDVTVSAQLR